MGDVGMLGISRALKSPNSIEETQARMVYATLNGNLCTTIVSYYRPTNLSDKTNIITFYNILYLIVLLIPKHNVLIIGGNIKAQIGKDGNNSLLVQLAKHK